MIKTTQKETIKPFSIEYLSANHEPFSVATIQYHDAYEFLYVTKGERYVLLNHQHYVHDANELIFIKRRDLHRYLVKNNSVHSRYMVEFLPAFLSNVNISFVQKLKSLESGIISLNKKTIPVINYIFENLDLYNEKDYEYVKHLVLELIHFFDRNKESYKPAIGSEDADFFAILSYIDKNFKRPLSLIELANINHVSKSHLCRLFKKHTNETCISYINKIRIREAKKMLEYNECSITNIAYQIGFQTLNHFERTFKNETKQSPRQYQKKFLETN